MTAGEQTSLNQLAEFVRDWRDDDKKWKEDVTARLKELEDDKIARDAVRKDRQQSWSNNMWKTIAIAGFLSTTAAGLTIAVLRLVLHV